MSEILLKIFVHGSIQVTLPYRSESRQFLKSEISRFATNSLLEALENKGVDPKTLDDTFITMSYYHERFGFVNVTENNGPSDGAHVDVYFDKSEKVVIVADEVSQDKSILETSTGSFEEVTAELYEIDPTFKDIVENCPPEYKRFLYLDKKPLDVPNILKNDMNNMGSKVIKDFNSTADPDTYNKLRKRLQRSLSDYMLQNCERPPFPSKAEMCFMAHCACLYFPCLRQNEKLKLGWEYWCDPFRCSGALFWSMSRKRQEKGLSTKQVNPAKRLLSVGTPKQRAPLSQTDEHIRTEVLEIERELRRKIPKSPDQINQCVVLMKETAQCRQTDILTQSLSLTDIINHWPRFADIGNKLIPDEFNFVLENHFEMDETPKTADIWAEISPRLLKIALKSKRDAVQDKILTKMKLLTDMDIDSSSEDVTSFVALLMLPFLLKSPTQGHSAATAFGHLVFFCEDGKANTSGVSEAKQDGAVTQPILLFETSDGSFQIPSQIYLILDRYTIEVQGNATKALELLYMCFWCFNVEYPKPLATVYNFLDALFGMHTVRTPGKGSKKNKTRFFTQAYSLLNQLDALKKSEASSSLDTI